MCELAVMALTGYVLGPEFQKRIHAAIDYVRSSDNEGFNSLV
eukprot:SAG11_NODE_6281_length_1344_cov_2.567068_1_plen_41_part_10